MPKLNHHVLASSQVLRPNRKLGLISPTPLLSVRNLVLSLSFILYFAELVLRVF